MSVACRKVNKSAFREYEYPLTCGKLVSLNVLSHLFGFYGICLKPCHINLAVEMSGIAHDCAVFYDCKVFFVDNFVTARNRDKEIADLGCFLHGHYIKSVHYRFDCFYGVNFGNDYSRTEALGSHCCSFTAPAVACYNHDFACND